jgi:hypothetical protein
VTSNPVVTLDTPQVNRLVDIARRYYGLALAIDPIRAMVDAKWDDSLDAAKRELLDTVWALLAILRTPLPDLSADQLGGFRTHPTSHSASLKRSPGERLKLACDMPPRGVCNRPDQETRTGASGGVCAPGN